MTPLQRELARQIIQAAADAGGRRIVYRTEYLGYLPFGQYPWVTVAGRDVSEVWPDGWGWGDLESLADAGVLDRVSRSVNPQDDSECESQYDVVASDADPAMQQTPRRDSSLRPAARRCSTVCRSARFVMPLVLRLVGRKWSVLPSADSGTRIARGEFQTPSRSLPPCANSPSPP